MTRSGQVTLTLVATLTLTLTQALTLTLTVNLTRIIGEANLNNNENEICKTSFPIVDFVLKVWRQALHNNPFSRA